MLKKEDIIKKMTEFFNGKLDELSINNSAIMLFRPIVQRVIKKSADKVGKFLDLLSDENGMIDIENILSEVGNNLISIVNKNYPEICNGIKINDGKIIMEIPFIGKELVFTKEDIEELKNYLMK